MSTTTEIPIILTTSVINLFNKLIDSNSINIKKFYKINNYILENNILNFKNIYCKHRTNKNKLCLSKCINSSKYCKLHDPIMKEQRKINRINMNNKRKILKKEIKIFMNIDYSYFPFTKTDKIGGKGLIQNSIDITNKSENNIRNSIDNNEIRYTFIDGITYEAEQTLKYFHYFNKKNVEKNIIYINKGIRNIKVNEDFKPIVNELLAIKYYNNKEIIIPNVDEYKEKLNKIDYSIFTNYKGHKIHKLVENIIKTQLKAYYTNDPLLLNSNDTSTFISNIINKILQN